MNILHLYYGKAIVELCGPWDQETARRLGSEHVARMVESFLGEINLEGEDADQQDADVSGTE